MFPFLETYIESSYAFLDLDGSTNLYTFFLQFRTEDPACHASKKALNFKSGFILMD